MKVDPIKKHIYLDVPVNMGEFLDALYEITGPEPESDYEWVIMPNNAMSYIYQS